MLIFSDELSVCHKIGKNMQNRYCEKSGCRVLFPTISLINNDRLVDGWKAGWIQDAVSGVFILQIGLASTVTL